MEQVWQWGIDVIITVQKLRSPFTDAFFYFVTFFGSQVFFMLILPALYWCTDKKYASRIFILFLISGWANSLLKGVFKHPRPYYIDGSVKIGSAGGYGLPSGHAQQSFVLFAALCLWLKNSKVLYTSIGAILLIAFSRVYLGVHFPTDILGGWLCGVIIIGILWPLFDRIEKAVSGFSRPLMFSSAIAVAALLSMIISSRWSVVSMGLLSGFISGLIVDMGNNILQPAENAVNGIKRYLLGMAAMVPVIATGGLMSFKHAAFHYPALFVLSWVCGIWVSAGAPRVFKKFRL